MIAKERQIPLIVFEIDAALSRISLIHPKRYTLEEDRRNYMAGYHGEKQIDYYLDSYIKGSPLYFANIRLLFDNQAFQMDTLIVTHYFIVIIESKNLAGILIFEKDSTQVIREWNSKIQGFINPIVQVKRQKKLLKVWLKHHKFPTIPIVDLVGIADRRTIIKTTPNNHKIFEKLTHADVIEDKIKQAEAVHTTKQLTTRQMNKLKQLLIIEHTPAQPSILKKHGIDVSELIIGVRCPHCGQYRLSRILKKWFCHNCKSYSKDAHRLAIQEYLHLISPTISNKQCREFLHINNPDTAKKILRSMDLSTSGTTKNRRYHRSTEMLN